MCAPAAAALWRQAPGIPFSLQWLKSMGSTRRKDRHTNGVDVHVRKKHGNIKSLPAGFLQTVQYPRATPDRRDVPLYFSPLSLSVSHTLLMPLLFFLPLPLPPCASLLYPTGPRRPPLHPSLCSPPVSTLIF